MKTWSDQRDIAILSGNFLISSYHVDDNLTTRWNEWRLRQSFCTQHGRQRTSATYNTGAAAGLFEAIFEDSKPCLFRYFDQNEEYKWSIIASLRNVEVGGQCCCNGLLRYWRWWCCCASEKIGLDGYGLIWLILRVHHNRITFYIVGSSDIIVFSVLHSSTGKCCSVNHSDWRLTVFSSKT